MFLNSLKVQFYIFYARYNYMAESKTENTNILLSEDLRTKSAKQKNAYFMCIQYNTNSQQNQMLGPLNHLNVQFSIFYFPPCYPLTEKSHRQNKKMSQTQVNRRLNRIHYHKPFSIHKCWGVYCKTMM